MHLIETRCPAPSETSAEPATIDRLLSVLATETRRSVLAYFETSATQTASPDDLTEHVGADQSAFGVRTPEQVRGRLHHGALPKVDVAGLIDYDPRPTTVRYREQRPIEKRDTLLAEVLE